jgi:hypothetical protein
MASTTLPAEFAELAPLAAEWALATERERAVKRVETPIERLRSLHDAVLPRIHDIIRYFNQLPNDPGALAPEQKTLYHLAEMFMEAAAPIDLGWSSGDIEDTFPMDRFEFVKMS